MKKLFMLCLSAVLALSLVACGGGETATEKKTEPEPTYHRSVLDELVAKGAFSEELETLDADTAFMLYRLEDYGLKQEDLAEAWVLRSAGATCEEVALLALAGQDDKMMAAAEQAMKDYIQNQIDTNVDYRPAEIPKLEQAIVSCKGWSVLTVVANDLDAAKAVIG